MNNELTIQDLAVMRSIIDAATRGGIFKAQDLSAVGVVHDKLNSIVEAFIEKNKEEQTESEAATEEATA
tara:strand:+ start:154 stop:360 length:207 start_codon:yes stop_codon:yes gene_type:complete